MGDHTHPTLGRGRMTLAALLLCSNTPISNSSCIPKLIRAHILELSVSVALSPQAWMLPPDNNTIDIISNHLWHINFSKIGPEQSTLLSLWATWWQRLCSKSCCQKNSVWLCSSVKVTDQKNSGGAINNHSSPRSWTVFSQLTEFPTQLKNSPGLPAGCGSGDGYQERAQRHPQRWQKRHRRGWSTSTLQTCPVWKGSTSCFVEGGH